LIAHGVLPHAQKREVFEAMLGEVVFPGLERYGVDIGPSKAWLARRIRGG
jgi:hypothetical protein